MGRGIRSLPRVDRAEPDGKPVGLQRDGGHDPDRRLFVVRLFLRTKSGLDGLASAGALTSRNGLRLYRQPRTRCTGCGARHFVALHRKPGENRARGSMTNDGYSAVQPPSIERLAPVIWAASSPQRNSASAATCSDVTNSLVGCACSSTS